MTIYGLMVTKNECHRYLQSSLRWNLSHVDGLLVYDDGSTDETEAVARSLGAEYERRPDSVPSFLEHEGHFRQAAIECMERVFEPVDGDWIFVVDADEFLVAENLRSIVLAAERAGCWSVEIRVPELWGLNPMVERRDGFWGSILCTRLYKWRAGGEISHKAMGSGAEPTYVAGSAIYRKAKDIFLLHAGYAMQEDREAKFARYSSLLNHGHNDSHIQSILQRPILREWTGPFPNIWRGIREEVSREV